MPSFLPEIVALPAVMMLAPDWPMPDVVRSTPLPAAFEIEPWGALVATTWMPWAFPPSVTWRPLVIVSLLKTIVWSLVTVTVKLLSAPVQVSSGPEKVPGTQVEGAACACSGAARVNTEREQPSADPSISAVRDSFNPGETKKAFALARRAVAETVLEFSTAIPLKWRRPSGADSSTVPMPRISPLPQVWFSFARRFFG